MKNLSVGAIISSGLAITFALVGSGCHNTKNYSGEKSIGQIMALDEAKNLTLIDELIEEGKMDIDDKLNIVEASDKLQEYIEIARVIGDSDYSEITSLTPLTDDEYEQALSLGIDYVMNLIEYSKYKGNDDALLERRLNAKKKLNYIKNNVTEWINENGKSISVKMLETAIRASVADEFSLDVEGYYSVVLPNIDVNASSEPFDYSIMVGEDEYTLPKGSQLWYAFDHLIVLTRFSPTSDQERNYKTYENARYYSLETILSGANLKNGSIIEAQNDKKYVKELLGKNRTNK